MSRWPQGNVVAKFEFFTLYLHRSGFCQQRTAFATKQLPASGCRYQVGFSDVLLVLGTWYQEPGVQVPGVMHSM